jgi:hypothetical protein
MPIYSVEGSDGTIYDIEAPEGVSEADLFSFARRQERKKRDAERREQNAQRLAAAQQAPVEEGTTFGGQLAELGKGIIPGAIGLLETSGTGISALLSSLSGDPQDEYVARKEIKKIAGIAKEPFAADPGYEDSVGRRLGEGLGSTLPFFGAGKLLGSTLGMAAGAGESREAAEAAGATGQERTSATLLGAPTGLLDMLAPSVPALTRVLGKEIGSLTSLMTTTLARAGVEGATEAAQRVAQNLIAKGVYNPEQPILAGSGEEGAYGAGVGALASLIMDLTLGRRARLAKFQKPAAPEAEAETLLLGGEGPFTPVVMPDGSVITSRAEYEQYVAGQDQNARARETDRRTSDPMAEMPADQRDLARRGKQAALEETFAQDMEPGQMGLPGIERAGSVEVPGVGRVTEQAQEEVTPAEDPTPAERDTQTRDMIDELETQQIEELQTADVTTAQQDEAEKARLKFESDLAETDARVKNAREKGTEERRLELLLPIVDIPDVNIPQLFAKELKRAGLVPEGTEAILTPREKKLIQRAYDLRLAETPVVEDVQVEDTQTDNAELESAIPEKDTQREPVQMGLPGMAKPKGTKPQAFSEEEIAAQEDKPFDTVLTSEVLDKTGLPKQSGFYKQLLNMDMSDPTQQPVIANIFGRVRENPNVKPATKEAVETLAMQAFGGLSKQGEMFGPRGAVLGGKPAKKETPSANKPADTGRAGAGASVGTAEAGKGKPVRATTTATEQPKAPDTDGLGADGKPASNAGVRKSDKPATVTPEAKVEPKKTEPVKTEVKGKPEVKAEPKKTEPVKTEVKGKPEVKAEPKKTEPAKTETKAEPKKAAPKPVQGENAYQMSKDQGEGDYAIRVLAADAYLNTAEDYSVKKAEAMLRDLNDGKDA